MANSQRHAACCLRRQQTGLHSRVKDFVVYAVSHATLKHNVGVCNMKHIQSMIRGEKERERDIIIIIKFQGKCIFLCDVVK